jgi:hypothetical protein
METESVGIDSNVKDVILNNTLMRRFVLNKRDNN